MDAANDNTARRTAESKDAENDPSAIAAATVIASRQKTVAITRSPDDAAEFLELARARDARALALPTIQLVGKGQKIVDEFLDAVREESPDYVVFMSSKAVRLLFETARNLDIDGGGADAGSVRADSSAGVVDVTGNGADSADASAADSPSDGSGLLQSPYGATANPSSQKEAITAYDKLRLAVANMTVVAVGPKTRESLEFEGIKVNEMPPTTFSSVGVGELFSGLGTAVGRKVIVPRSGASTPFLKELLTKIGLKVVELHLYDVCAFSGVAESWNEFRAEFASGRMDGIIFTSASSVRGFAEIMSRDYDVDGLAHRLSGVTIVSIGPFTADELKKTGVDKHCNCSVMSDVHTVQGAFQTLAKELHL